MTAADARSIYDVPMALEEQNLTDYIMQRFGLTARADELGEWKDFANRIHDPERTVRIACVGKYTNLADSYISHLEAFHHAGAEAGAKVQVVFVDSEVVQQYGITEELLNADGILIPAASAPGDRGQDRHRQVRPGEPHSFPRRLPGIPDRHHRVRQERAGDGGREQH